MMYLTILILSVFLLTGGAFAQLVAVSPGNDNADAVISQECPTFSWSEARGGLR